jgi:hypothetical protein
MATIPQWTLIESTGHHHTYEDAGLALAAAVDMTWGDKALTIRDPAGTEYALIRRDSKRSIHIVTRA